MAKIMLVEDDNNLREIYEARLQAEGYEIVSAQDGEEALAVAVKEKPDLIISDVMMPKISGFDMLDILRSTPETKDTKVVMMTALSQAEDKARADKLGADRYLVKSQVTLEDVVRVARDVLEGKPDTSSPLADTPPIIPAAPVASPAPAPAPDPAPTSVEPPAAPEPPADPTPPVHPPTPPSDPTPPVTPAPPTPPAAPPADPAPPAPAAPAQTTTEAPTDVATTPVADPVAAIAATDAAPAVAPAPEAPSAVDMPVVSPPRPLPTVDPNLAETTQEESQEIQQQIEQFISSQPTDPAPAADPATDSADAPAPTPAPAPQPEALVSAPEPIAPEPAPAAPVIPEPVSAPAPEPVMSMPPQPATTIPDPTPASSVAGPARAHLSAPSVANTNQLTPIDPEAAEPTEPVNVNGKKVIRPINDLTAPGPDLTKMAQEQEQRDNAMASVLNPPTGTVIGQGMPAPETSPTDGMDPPPTVPGQTFAPGQS
jgi:CheY-like chemotaxis protein